MRTRVQSASSSSAMISGSDVIEPCPISVAADRMVMVPSVAMLTHGLSACPARSTPKVAASARSPSANANDRPAAPIMNRRRETEAKRAILFMSRLACGALDRAHDALIGPAAADVGTHVLDDLGAGRLRLLPEQVDRAHDLAGLAVAALRHPFGEPGLLHRMAGIRR